VTFVLDGDTGGEQRSLVTSVVVATEQQFGPFHSYEDEGLGSAAVTTV
jgi:hypothetical protein